MWWLFALGYLSGLASVLAFFRGASRGDTGGET
jgi:hypothetical protein